MPIIYQKHIGSHGILGIWRITESVDELISMIKFTEEEQAIFDKFKVKSRQAHWLSYRVMVRRLMGDDFECNLVYDDNGKLQFKDKNYSISVTHSGLFSGAIISKNHYVGIDIEKLGDRINLLVDKFLHSEELTFLPAENQHQYLTVMWSAKEALYKLFGKSMVDFDRHIIISPFELDRQGSFHARIELEDLRRDYQMNYEFSDDMEYILVYSVDEAILISNNSKS